MAETVLVTGGAGYIGSHVVLALQDAGRAVVVIDNLSTGSERLLRPEVPFVQGNAGDGDLVARTVREHGVGAVMHFAASLSVPESVADPVQYYRNNTMNTLALASAAKDAGVRHLIFSSTAATYGEPKSVPVTEDADTRPINPYGASKLMSERILADISAAFPAFRYIALRYFNVAGADPAGRSGQAGPNVTHLVRVAMEVAVGRRPGLEVFGTDYPTPDGTCVRDYIHVSDLAAAHVAALAYLEAGNASAVFNCGYGRGFSVKEVLAAAARATGRPIPHRFSGRRPGDPAALIADATRLRTTLDWTPAHDDLEEIIRSAYAWELRLHNQR